MLNQINRFQQAPIQQQQQVQQPAAALARFGGASIGQQKAEPQFGDALDRFKTANLTLTPNRPNIPPEGVGTKLNLSI